MGISYMLAIANLLIAWLVVVVVVNQGDPSHRSARAGLHCAEPPLCAQRDAALRQQALCAAGRTPLPPSSDAYRRYVVARLQTYVERSIKGQLTAPSVVDMVRYKLSHLSEPMVLHFAGDNGVGKTRLAELISLAYGQRCGDESCTMGDTTLVLSGTGYDGMTASEFRKAVVPVVVEHARRHPRNGVVIINELSSLEPAKVRVLLPLLGRAVAFPEYPTVHVTPLLVILTTDFGREGRTRGKTLSEMRAFIDEEFKELYSAPSASFIRTLPFLPISLETAADIVRVVVREIGCSARPPLCLDITDTAVLWLVEKTKAALSVENGRAVAQESKLHVGSLVERLREDSDATRATRPPVAADPSAFNCTTRRCTVFVDEEGAFDMAC